MTAYDPAQWSDFALAQLGASAALLGLVFVGLSINLRDILASPLLVNRAAETIVLLASVLVVATAVLIPGQSSEACGIELVALGVVASLALLHFQTGVAADVAAHPDHYPRHSAVTLRRVISLGSALVVLLAGILVLVEAGGGLYWWPAAIVAAYLAALTNAWVLLVEILR
jgi:modulator of FtsH protease